LEGWAGRVDLYGAVEPPQDHEGAVVIGDERPPTAGHRPTEPAGDPVHTRWRLFTSGTTGEPKPVDHTLSSLTRTIQATPQAGGARRRWGLLYEPTRMAGIQVLLQSLVAGEHLLDATVHAHLPERLRWLAAAGADALSATPTVWRQVLQSEEPTALPLRQITLGGEIADQRVLDALARTFPAARITHVFASTETGAAFAVSDGREGFPRSFLTEGPRGVDLEVRDGILHVWAPGASGAGPDGFVSTGDVVEVRKDRVHFLGRASGVVNVGGVTVAPEQVETLLRALPGVVDAVVRPRRNPFSGWILTADVVAGDGVDGRALPGALRAALSDRLPSAAVPASVKVVPELQTSVTGKAGRR
jgi:acyl-coenzyme A synthetase/AMP-(fatty) acid ligase